MKSLNLKNIEWKEFEILVLHLAENIISGTRFDDHLKQGNRQSGIDLIARSQSTDHPLCIQCKRHKDLSKSKIEDLITVFLNDKYAIPKTRFILATTADLHTESLNDVLEEQKKLLKSKDIEFEWWDEHFISTHLQQNYPIAARFFGLHVAKSFCLPAIQIQSFTQPIDPILARQISPLVILKQDFSRQFWQSTTGPISHLTELFTTNRLSIQRIGLVADPYIGKSIYLRQCAYELVNSGQHIQPLFLNVKDENIDPIDSLLARRFHSWESSPQKNLIVFIDGLDEAHSNDILAFTKYIDSFTSQYPSVSIVISCRKQFYDHYQLSSKVSGFQFYSFSSLKISDVQNYIKNRLGDHADRFNKAVTKKQFNSWLQHPFYLNQLIEQFERNAKLPSTKIKAIEIFIEQAYSKGKERSFEKGILAQKAHESRLVAQKLAFSLQLLESNALENDLFQQIFLPAERKLLEHSPLITIKNDRWSFTNAFFQEHLAALHLRHYSFSELCSFFTIGSIPRKFRTRWLQTLYALLSLLPEQPALLNQMVQLVQDDNPELIFASEPTLYDQSFRLESLQRLIAYCHENDLWPQLIYPDKMGEFLTGVDQAIDKLLEHLSDPTFPISIKIVCCRILTGFRELLKRERQQISSTVHHQLSSTTDAMYAAELIAILSTHEIGDQKDIQTVLNTVPFSQYHIFRHQMYEWISSLNLTDSFWSYGIDGIPIFIDYNKPITQMGSSRHLRQFLLSCKHRHQLYPLFAGMQNRELAPFYWHKNENGQDFTTLFLAKCAELMHYDPLITLPISNFLQSNTQHYILENPKGIEPVIADLTCRDLLARHFGATLFAPKYWALGALLNPKSMDYLLWEFEESEQPIHYLNTPLQGLEMLSSNDESKSYEKLVKDITEGQLIDLAALKHMKELQQVQNQRIELDMKCIQSLDSFRKAIQRLFTLHKTKSIGVHSLYQDRIGPQRKASSHFITQFIHHWIMQGDIAKLEDCLTFLESESNFRYFRASEILDYSYAPEKFQTFLMPLIQEYYYSELSRCNFAKAEANYAANLTSPLEELIIRIFLKYKLPTRGEILVEFLWMDTAGFDKQSYYRLNTPLLRSQVKESIGQSAALFISEAVLKHMEAGIHSHRVMATHIDLCVKLEIEDCKSYILDALYENLVDAEDLHEVVKAYKALKGNLNELLPLLESISLKDPFYIDLLNELKDEFALLVCEKARGVIAKQILPQEANIQFAKLLTSIGDIDGFGYLVSSLEKVTEHSYHLSNVFLKNLDTRQALTLLKPLLYLLVDPSIDRINSPDHPRAILYGWLNLLAEKSLQDILLLSEWLLDAERDLISKYPAPNALRWYAFRLLEKTRDTKSTPYSVAQIKELSTISN